MRAGWWTVFASPFDTAQWTLDNYTRVLDEGFSNAFLNTLAVAIPSTVIPIMIAAFAAYAFAWMDFPGRNFLFVVVVGSDGRSAADGAHPDPAGLHRSST